MQHINVNPAESGDSYTCLLIWKPLFKIAWHHANYLNQRCPIAKM